MSRQDLYERSPASFRDNVFGGGAASDDVDVFFARFCFRGQRCVEIGREYFGDFHAVDEWRARIGNLPDSRLAPIPSPSDEVERKNPAVCNEPVPRSGTRDGLSVRLDGPDGSRIVWTIADPVAGDGWSSARLEAVERLLPHVRQYVRARQALVDARAPGSSLADLLETVRVGFNRLDRRARIVAANHRARALLLTVDPADRIDSDRVAAALDLTPAQSHAAISLAEGRTIRDIAVETGRSATTIKWHIRQICARHSLSRQTELVQLVESLADVPGVPRGDCSARTLTKFCGISTPIHSCGRAVRPAQPPGTMPNVHGREPRHRAERGRHRAGRVRHDHERFLHTRATSKA